MAKKTLLVVAPGLPEFDRHAGSRRLYSWLRILATEYHVALHVLQTRINEDSKRYAEALRALGVEIFPAGTRRWPVWPGASITACSSSSFTPRNACSRLCGSCGRICPWPSPPRIFTTFESRAPPSMPIIPPWRERKRGSRAGGSLACTERADLVLTVTEDDRRELLRAAPDTVTAVVPNTYPIATDVPVFSQRIPRSLLFVGGFRHSPNVDAALFFCRQVLPLVRRSLPDVTVTIVGHAPPKEVQALASANVTVTGWVPHVEPYLASHCISIAPLRFGAGLKGKIVEAMGAGLPVVTTSVGAEGMELVHGRTALIADSPEMFAASVVRLCTDPDLHATTSGNGLEHARARWDSR